MVKRIKVRKNRYKDETISQNDAGNGDGGNDHYPRNVGRLKAGKG